jgi:accessory gene regulator protein AgrB
VDSKSTRALICVCVISLGVVLYKYVPCDRSNVHASHSTTCLQTKLKCPKTEVLAFLHVLGRLVPFPSLTLSFCNINFNVILSYILVHRLLQDVNIIKSIVCSLCSLLLFVDINYFSSCHIKPNIALNGRTAV